MSVDPDAVRQAMRHWATGLAIFAAQHAEIKHGMTVSSFTSVTLDPPMVLASIQKDARTYKLAEKSGCFAITILSEDQQYISERFAGHTPDEEDRFAGLQTETLVTGAPFIVGGLAYFDCKIINRVDFASHTIFIGEILATKDNNNAGPLIYYNRAYRRLQE
jgi:flavin reductase (DIM6/NTAB) family NADH-FMN oxidoreductase RutF